MSSKTRSKHRKAPPPRVERAAAAPAAASAAVAAAVPAPRPARRWREIKILAFLGLAAVAAQWITADSDPSPAGDPERHASDPRGDVIGGALIDGSEDLDVPPAAPAPQTASSDRPTPDVAAAPGIGPPPASPVAPPGDDGDAPPFDPLPPDPAGSDPIDPLVASPGPEGYWRVSLVLLGYFDYAAPEGKVEDPAALIDQVPPEIRELNERKIAIRGYMVPLEFEKGRVKTFLLTNNTLMCCYGVTPALNEFIHVTMEGDTSARYLNNIPVTVYGTLHIGEEVRRGYVVSLYRMTAEKALGPADLARAKTP